MSTYKKIPLKVFLILLLVHIPILGIGEDKKHPRLLMEDGRESAVLYQINNNTSLKLIHEAIIAEAGNDLLLANIERRIDGGRMLNCSREAVRRILNLAYAYRMTEDKRYAKKATELMLYICSYEDWNPEHFLDTAEMAFAISIGYDWIYGYLSKKQRKTIAEAVRQKAITAATDEDNNWFSRSKTNWNQVCNSSLTWAALAFWEHFPQEAERTIEKNLETISLAFNCYSKDGCYLEGPNYWEYGSMYQSLMIEALESVYGHTFSLIPTDGFLKSAYFINFTSAPSGLSFNFSDSSIKSEVKPLLYWFANRLNDYSVLAQTHKNIQSNKITELGYMRPIYLIYMAEALEKMDETQGNGPRTQSLLCHEPQDLYIYRSGWDRSDDCYLGVKGGSASANHGHMDAGSFIYEQNGVRWSSDPVTPSYESMESQGIEIWDVAQGGERWQIPNYGNMGHSTISIKDQEHRIFGHASIIQSFDSNDKHGVTLDMSNVLGEYYVQKALREIYVDEDESLHIIDRISNSDKATDFTWVLHTDAEIDILSPDKIILSKQGKVMNISVNSSKEIDTYVISDSVQRLVIEFRLEKNESTNFVVDFIP